MSNDKTAEDVANVFIEEARGWIGCSVIENYEGQRFKYIRKIFIRFARQYAEAQVSKKCSECAEHRLIGDVVVDDMTQERIADLKAENERLREELEIVKDANQALRDQGKSPF